MKRMRCGIVGLPNVGKSTFYNLLAGGFVVPAENYPFCTIEPHSSNISVPDARLDELSKIAGSKKILYAALTLVDIAGLIEGASKGEGLGNQFLSNISTCNVLLHMVRCYVDDDIVHVMNRISPLDDIKIIDNELILADMQTLENRQQRLERKTKSGDNAAKAESAVVGELLESLNSGCRASSYTPSSDAKRAIFESLNLLTAKPVVYVCNVSESEISTGNEWTRQISGKYDTVMIVAAKMEGELSAIDDADERMTFLEAAGLKESSLNQVIRMCYQMLGVHSFFTVGPKEARAWTIDRSATAYDAAGEIHTDFQKGFIRAEVISYSDYLKHNGEQGCKNSGAMRIEGRDYVVHDGDVMHFRFNL